MTEREALELALEALERCGSENYTIEREAINAIREVLAQQCVCGEQNSAGTHRTDGPCLAPQTEQEQIAVWLEKECDEQYLADRVRAGDYAKQKGHTENCAAFADDIGKRHLSPSLVGVGESNSTSQPEQEPVANYCKECLTYNGHHEGCSHYTTPPQRTWVGLTDEDVREVSYDFPPSIAEWYDRDFTRFIHALEAKLKEKNT